MTGLWAWTRIVLTGIALIWWATQVIHVLEWQDRHADRARARQHKMTSWAWVITNMIAKLGRWPILAAGAVGAAVIVATTAAIPWTLTAVPIALAAAGYRNLTGDPNTIIQLRQALIDVVGPTNGRPPKVTYSGKHPEGGPLRITIYPPPGWKDWKKTTRDELESAINMKMGPVWEAVEWHTNGVTVWERLPKLPDLAPHPGHIDLPWNHIPIGVDGAGQPALLKLGGLHPHALIGGSTGAGKTSIMRSIAAHLLHHGVTVAALDMNYTGLAFLEGRPGVAPAMDGFEDIARAVTHLRNEVENRLVQHKRDRTYRRPLVVLIDEVEQLFDRARQVQKRAPGVKEPPLVSDVHELLRTGRKVKVHVILATQRPDAVVIPGALREQAKGRVAVGPMGQKAAEMMLDQQAERAKNTPEVVGRAVLWCGTYIGWAQTYWLADPDDTDHPQADRDMAEALLPPRGIGNGAKGLDTNNQQGDLFATALGRPPILLEPVVTVASTVVDDDPRAAKRARDRKHREIKLAELVANPGDPRHGTQSARTVGCKCDTCRPELAKAST